MKGLLRKERQSPHPSPLPYQTVSQSYLWNDAPQYVVGAQFIEPYSWA